MKPHITGDVFTDSETTPQVFRIGRSVQTRKWATVNVICYWNDDLIGKMRKRVTIRLIPHGKTWLIDNVLYENSPDLITDFLRKDYFDG